MISKRFVGSMSISMGIELVAYDASDIADTEVKLPCLVFGLRKEEAVIVDGGVPSAL